MYLTVFTVVMALVDGMVMIWNVMVVLLTVMITTLVLSLGVIDLPVFRVAGSRLVKKRFEGILMKNEGVLFVYF